MHPQPDDLEQWIAVTLSRSLPASAQLRIDGMVARETGKGWPWHLVDAVVLRDDQPIERRIGAFFRFFEYAGSATVRIEGLDSDHEISRSMLPLLESAEPDWSDEIVGLHQLWSV